MGRKNIFLILICCFCMGVTACGPSEEKLSQAREKYVQLAEANNVAAEAYKDIADDSLEKPLAEIKSQIAEVESVNLAEMKDEEIDALIQKMDLLIEDYEGILTKIADIKAAEEAAVLTPVALTVENIAGITFTSLKLYEKGSYETPVNVLENMEVLASGQTLTGLVLQKDVEDTPWMLVLEEEEGEEYKFELPVAEYKEEEIKVKLVYDAEAEELKLEREH